jgi:hypothetical protein
MSKNLFSICSSLVSVAPDQTGDICNLLNVAKLELCRYAEIADLLIAVVEYLIAILKARHPKHSCGFAGPLANLSIRPALSVNRRTLQTLAACV